MAVLTVNLQSTLPDLGAYEYGSENGGADWKAGNNVEMHYDGTSQNVSVNPLEFSSFRMNPNPASSVLYFEGLPEKSEVRLIDITGKTVLRISLTTESISLSELPKGLYLIQVKNSVGMFYQKLIKH